jgi:hypothetical protein
MSSSATMTMRLTTPTNAGRASREAPGTVCFLMRRETAMGRGCVKTHLWRNFGGPSILGAIEKVDPDAIWRVDVAPNTSRREFSHGLGRVREFRAVNRSHSMGAGRCSLHAELSYVCCAIAGATRDHHQGSVARIAHLERQLDCLGRRFLPWFVATSTSQAANLTAANAASGLSLRSPQGAVGGLLALLLPWVAVTMPQSQ